MVAEERYRALFEESKDMIFVSTSEGKLVDVNPAAVELFGYESEEEMLKIDVARDLYLYPAEREKFEEMVKLQGYVKDLEVELKRKDGQKITVLEMATAVRDQTGKIITYRGIIRDITNEKKLEEQLRHAQKIESIGTAGGRYCARFKQHLGHHAWAHRVA